MGFCYAINPYSNRQTLCCDFCNDFKGCSFDKVTLKVVKKPCPYGYCQAYATCNNCNDKNNKELHLKNKCDINNAEFEKMQQEEQQLLNQGHFLRTSATANNNTEVAVTFTNKERIEKVFLMKTATYHAIPLMSNATISDYQKIENITEI